MVKLGVGRTELVDGFEARPATSPLSCYQSHTDAARLQQAGKALGASERTFSQTRRRTARRGGRLTLIRSISGSSINLFPEAPPRVTTCVS
jgi:hypothetical protein